jgi:hypothetical protein
MKLARIIVGLSLVSAACFGQEQYKNSKWHFSFTVPEGWELLTDRFELDRYAEEQKLRFDDEILAICHQGAGQDETNIMLVQARTIGDAREGLVPEDFLKEQLRSNWHRPYSLSYVNDFEQDLVDRKLAPKEPNSKFQIWYDRERNIYFETVIVPLLSGRTEGMSTVRILGGNRVVTLSFELHGTDIQGPYSLIEEVVDSFAYGKYYGFGQAPPTSIFRTVWFWLFPGFGVLIVGFLLYKWAAAEYG